MSTGFHVVVLFVLFCNAQCYSKNTLLETLPELLPAPPGCDVKHEDVFGESTLSRFSPMQSFLEHVCNVHRSADRLLNTGEEAEVFEVIPRPISVLRTFSLDAEDDVEVKYSFEEPSPGLEDELPELAYTLGGWMAPMQGFIANELCRQHSRAYLEQINKAAPWALRMFDASGKMPDGIFYGNFNLLGSWDECLNVTVQLNETEYPNITQSSFTGRYALAQFLNPAVFGGSRKTDDEDKLGMIPLLPVVPSFGKPAFRILYGYCIPSSCTNNDVTFSLNGWMRLFNSSSLVVFGSDSHVADETEQLDGGDIAVIAVLAVFGAVIAVCTVLDVIGVIMKSREPALHADAYRERGRLGPFAPANWQLVQAFSLRFNGKKLLSTRTGADNLGCIHGIRFITMTWVLLGHNYIFAVFNGAWMNTAHLQDILAAPAIEVISNALLSVDTFFFLGGLMLAYAFMKTVKSNGGKVGWLDIPMLYLHRYLRLTPVYAMVVGVTATLARRFGTAPALDSAMQQQATPCQDNWWRNLLYINNYGDAAAVCIGQSWYLPVDFQLFIVAPFMILPWIYNKKVGAAWLGLLTAASVAIPAAVTYIEDLPPTNLFFNIHMDQAKFFTEFYEVPWCRATVYICGLWLGLLLHHIRTNKITVRIPLMVNVLVWGVMSAMGLAIVYSTHEWNKDLTSTWTRAQAVSYGSLHRLGWGIALGWVIFACVTGHGGFADTILSFKGFIPLGRLTYATYLVAVQVQAWYFSSFKIAGSFDNTIMVTTFLSNLLVSLVIGAVFSLCFEAPMMTIEKMIFAPRKRKTAPVKNGAVQSHETSHEGVTRL